MALTGADPGTFDGWGVQNLTKKTLQKLYSANVLATPSRFSVYLLRLLDEFQVAWVAGAGEPDWSSTDARGRSDLFPPLVSSHFLASFKLEPDLSSLAVNACLCRPLNYLAYG